MPASKYIEHKIDEKIVLRGAENVNELIYMNFQTFKFHTDMFQHSIMYQLKVFPLSNLSIPFLLI